MKKLLVFIGLLISIEINAQVFTLPDTNLRNCLLRTYPTLFNSNKDLIISNANSFPSTLSCGDCSVNNLNGLEFFKSAATIAINGTNAKIIPAFDAPNLKKVNFKGNKLEEVIFKSAPQMFDIRLQENNLNKIIGLENVPRLEYFNCHDNFLTELKGLETAYELVELTCQNNKISSICDLKNLKKLRILNADSNSMTFQDLLPIATHPNFNSNFTLGGQSKIGNDQLISITGHEKSVSLSFGVDVDVPGTIFTWYKNGLLVNSSGSTLVLHDPTISDTGTYTCLLTNTHPNLRNIVLTSNTIRLTAKQCPSLQNIEYIISHPKCEGLGKVTFIKTIESSIIQLKGDKYDKEFNGNNANELESGTFNYKVLNKEYCLLAKGSFEIPERKEDCQYFTISPNADGNEDQFYIPEKGVAKVYNKAGALIKEIPTPHFWDGSDHNGKVQIGLYIIHVSEKKYKVYVY